MEISPPKREKEKTRKKEKEKRKRKKKERKNQRKKKKETIKEKDKSKRNKEVPNAHYVSYKRKRETHLTPFDISHYVRYISLRESRKRGRLLRRPLYLWLLEDTPYPTLYSSV